MKFYIILGHDIIQADKFTTVSEGIVASIFGGDIEIAGRRFHSELINLYQTKLASRLIIRSRSVNFLNEETVFQFFI